MTTAGKREFTYGRFEARIKAARGPGPLAGLLAARRQHHEVSWPQSGEIDIFEYRGQEPLINHGTMHGPGYSGGAGITRKYTLADGAQRGLPRLRRGVGAQRGALVRRRHASTTSCGRATSAASGCSTRLLHHPECRRRRQLRRARGRRHRLPAAAHGGLRACVPEEEVSAKHPAGTRSRRSRSRPGIRGWAFARRVSISRTTRRRKPTASRSRRSWPTDSAPS
jgi:hypothetical protein